jgi:sigma-B regulation protein RsbU (phosphoserine phosphatase)
MRAHEQDLQLATQIQATLLPARDIRTPDWETHYRYQPAGVVGGDYCEIVVLSDGRSLFFALGDVTGKGVAASLLMAHLSAIYRSLLSLDLPLVEIMSRANRLFCESTPTTHSATLVAGRAAGDTVELCNAGHCRPLLLLQGETERIDPTGLPLGLFCDSPYAVRHIRLNCGDNLILYSDGITEAQGPQGESYDEERLIRLLHNVAERDAMAMADSLLRDVTSFRDTGAQQDDMTLLMLRRHH